MFDLHNSTETAPCTAWTPHRAATPENEKQLLNIARHGTAAHMERLVRVYRRCRKQADASPGERAIRREERFCCYDEDDETMVFGGRVAVEQGRLLLKALDAMVAEMEKDDREAGDAQTADVARTAGNAAQADETGEFGETREDGDRTPKAAPGIAGNVSAETPAAASGEIVSAETPPLKPLRVRRATALEDERGEVLNIGRRSRIVPWHIADGGLIFIDPRHRPIPPAIHPQFGDRL